VGNNLPLSALVARLGVDQTVQGRYHKGLIELADVGVAEGTSGGPLISKATGHVVGVVLLSGHPTAVAWARPITDVSAKLREWALLPAGTSCQFTKAAKTIPLTLVTITPRTGVNGLEGEDLADGVELAIREKKEDLARVGYQVTLQREDDAGLPATAREKASAVAQDPKVITRPLLPRPHRQPHRRAGRRPPDRVCRQLRRLCREEVGGQKRSLRGATCKDVAPTARPGSPGSRS
jgi:hypothetical protein